MGRELVGRPIWLRLLLVGAICAATSACLTEPGPPYPYYDYPYYGWYAAPHYGGYHPDHFYLRGGWGHREDRHGAPHGGKHPGGGHGGGSGGHHH